MIVSLPLILLFVLMFNESAEMMKCLPPPTNRLSKYAPLIHIMKVCLFLTDQLVA